MDNNLLQVFVEMRPSKRLYYRVLNEGDFDFYYKLNTEERVMQYAYKDAFTNEEEAIEGFKEVLENQQDDEKGTQFVVLTKDTDEAIGIVDYHINVIHPSGGIYELGYFILPDFWGKGYATEMAKSMRDYLFENFNVHKVTGTCHKDNKASEGIMTKLNMILEGSLRKARFKDRLWVDELCYGILREEWEQYK